MNKEIYLVGIGNYTEVVIELAHDCGYLVKGLYHYSKDRVGETVMGVEVLDTTENVLQKDITGKQFAFTMGDNKLRQTLANKFRAKGGLTPSLIHPNAVISPSAKIGVGCFIFFNAIIWTKSILGNDCIVSSNGMISHHATLQDACYITAFSIVGTYCNVGSRVLFGVNSVLLPKALVIGDDCVLGAKSNVTKSFPKNSLLVGNPAQKIKEIK